MTTQVSTISAPETRRRKAFLESKLKALLRVSFEREELRVENLADPLDQVRSSMDREMAVRQFDRETHLVHDIQLALDKIETGSYGICELCEEPVPQRRLDAIPWARFCVPCQADAEASAQVWKPVFENAA